VQRDGSTEAKKLRQEKKVVKEKVQEKLLLIKKR
jgi:hypothetical protein